VLAVVNRVGPIVGPLATQLFNRRALDDLKALYELRAVLPAKDKRLAKGDAAIDKAFAALAGDSHGRCLGGVGETVEAMRDVAARAASGVK